MKHFCAPNWVGRLAGLALIWLLSSSVAWAQAPAWQSAIAINSLQSKVTATVADADGNVYITGYFRSRITFGTVLLNSAGAFDAFVAKWSPASASFVWVQRIGGPDEDMAVALALQGTDVYVAGDFSSASVAIGNTVLTNPNPGASDVFVAKISDAGSSSSFTWALRAGSPRYEMATAIAVSGANVYIAGMFDTTASFGSTMLTSAGLNDAYIAKLTDAGTTASFTWAQRAGGAGDDEAHALATNATSVYAAGNFAGATATFGSTTLLNTSYVGSEDVFVTKLTDTGAASTFSWTQQASSNDTDDATALAVSGNTVYVAGEYYGPTARFGATTLTSVGGYNSATIFVASLTDAGAAGSFAWVQQAGGFGNNYVYGLAVNATGLYIAGGFSSPTISFGTTTLTNTVAGGTDIFVAKLGRTSSAHDFIWAQQAGGNSLDTALALALGGATVYVAGWVSSSVSIFSSLLLPNLTSSITGFLASLTDPTLLATTPSTTVLPGLTLAPNPTHHATMVTLPAQPPGSSTAIFTLRDALGRRVQTETTPVLATGLRYELSVANLAPGLYSLQVQAGSATVTRKLVVE